MSEICEYGTKKVEVDSYTDRFVVTLTFMFKISCLKSHPKIDLSRWNFETSNCHWCSLKIVIKDAKLKYCLLFFNRLYYAQSLYKACLYEEAMKVSCQIDNPQYAGKVSSSDLTMVEEDQDYTRNSRTITHGQFFLSK